MSHNERKDREGDMILDIVATVLLGLMMLSFVAIWISNREREYIPFWVFYLLVGAVSLWALWR